MDKFLHRINKSANYNIFLIDKDGYILRAPLKTLVILSIRVEFTIKATF
jgi:hypothetical protein